MPVSENSRYSWAQSATTRTVINLRRPGARWQPLCSASSPPPYAPPVLGRLSQLLLLPGQATSRRVTACGSAVRSACLFPAAIPPHLCRDESRQKCSGQPGYGRPGRWRRHCRIPLPLHPPKTAPEGRCQASPSTSCCYSTVSDGPFRPRPRRPSAFPHRRSLPLLQGACSLPSAALQSPPPHTSRPPPGPTLHCVPRPWWFGDSKPGSRISVCADSHVNPRPAVPPSRLQTTKAPKLTYASAAMTHRPPYPARTGEKG